MAEKKSILFVCLGNICRSPTCEGICRVVAKDEILVESASTSSYHRNECPDERSQDICMKHGIDISGHRARSLRSDDWQRFDVIAALDENVFQILQGARPADAKAKLVLFNPPNGIADPYYGGRSGFKKMFNQIAEAMMPFLVEHGLMPEQ